MKTLTICQPYPELICRREKRVENREWFTNYRGPLLIHAGKSRDWLSGETDEELEQTFGRRIEFGAIVAKSQLVACLHIDKILSGQHDRAFPWLREHHHTSGTWCWVLEEVKRLERPIPWRGAQGLWEYVWPQ